MRISHDDQLRQAGAIKDQQTPTLPAGVSLRRPFPRPEQLARRARAQGGMKAFLAMARSIQRLRE